MKKLGIYLQYRRVEVAKGSNGKPVLEAPLWWKVPENEPHRGGVSIFDHEYTVGRRVPITCAPRGMED